MSSSLSPSSHTRRTFLVLVGAALPAASQDRAPGRWTARWISVPDRPPVEYGVYHFRRVVALNTVPPRVPIQVSADNRYQLFINGRRVLWGPARGDLAHWRYETLDIAPYLRPGRNVLAAVVWNFARYAPEAQVFSRTGFLLQAPSDLDAAMSTGTSWKCLHNQSYTAIPKTTAEMRGYFVVGPGDRVDAARYPWGWEQLGFDDSAWIAAEPVPAEAARWVLVPRAIPFEEEVPERALVIRLAEGAAVKSFPLEVAPRSKVRLILDQTYLTTGYPELILSGGKGASVSVAYAESLYNAGSKRGDKGDRSEVEGKEFLGYNDLYLADGGKGRAFRPLWWRTWRYIELVAETQAEALRVESLQGTFCGYPFERKARFESDHPRLGPVLDVGWRTARLCAHETYMDCPYYEQLQYVGDTRIQALVSLYNSGDDRLMRNAIEQIDATRTPDGLTMSRGPTRTRQTIPSFSLWWIAMIHDHWRYRGDVAFVRSMLPGMRAVLGFFARLEKSNGSLGPIPEWAYMDWANDWNRGNPPQEPDGSSASYDLLHLLILGYAAELEDAAGSADRAQELRKRRARLLETVRELYWDPARRLFADTPSRKQFSQHATTLAVLAGVVEGAEARRLMESIVADTSLTACSYYFKYYLHLAVNLTGLGDRYIDLLGEWFHMLDVHLSTWAERQEGSTNASRSDCHAWTASPNIELFRTVLGIDSAAPGFSRVLVRPFLGKLTRASGAIPHPRGEVSVKLERRASGIAAEISLPAGVSGEFQWQGQSQPLKPGLSRISL